MKFSESEIPEGVAEEDLEVRKHNPATEEFDISLEIISRDLVGNIILARAEGFSAIGLVAPAASAANPHAWRRYAFDPRPHGLGSEGRFDKRVAGLLP